MTDELDHVRGLRPPVSAPSRKLVKAERNRLMTIIDREARHEAGGPRRRKKRWLVPGLAIAALVTAAAGYALTRDLRTSTEISCPDAIVDAVTGDPVADCANLWRQQNGTEPPPLVAYDNQRGGIEVVPAGADVPAEWTPLEAGVVQDPRLIELDAALADYGDGLNATCYTPESAQPLAESALRRLGLVDWSVRIDQERDGGDGTCATHLVDPETRAVVISALEMNPPPADAPFRRLATSVQAQIDDQCLSRVDAVNSVRRIAADLGINESAGELIMHSVPDASAECSRTDVNVGGRIEVTVRGA
ncbi:MAG: hypothetical protein Q8K58_01590 [Acidimicrobiales bacterium]|nr:hypothetical protein [Acidimicrobiales bacterium]